MNLLLLGCSQKKRAEPGLAINVYDGPLFRVVRKALRECTMRDTIILILSARYGLIDAHTIIEPYDQRMTEARALELITEVNHRSSMVEQVLLGVAVNHRISAVHVSMGATYLKAMPETMLMVLFPFARVTWASGSIGERASQLKRWIAEPHDFLIDEQFLERLTDAARKYGQGDYTEVIEFVDWCHKEVGRKVPDLTPYEGW